jgi:hypothetical protein
MQPGVDFAARALLADEDRAGQVAEDEGIKVVELVILGLLEQKVHVLPARRLHEMQAQASSLRTRSRKALQGRARAS